MNQRITLEAIAPGDTHASTRVTISEAHIVWFAGLTGDFNPSTWMRKAQAKGRSAGASRTACCLTQ